MSAIKIMELPACLPFSALTKLSLGKNLMKKQNKFFNGPRKKVHYTTLSYASPEQEAYRKNNKLS
jgi:hypothetical protein